MTVKTGLTYVVSKDGSCTLANTKASSLQNRLTTAWELLASSFLQESTARLNWLQASLCVNWNQASPQSVNGVMGEFLYKLTMENCWLLSGTRSLAVYACVRVCVSMHVAVPLPAPDILDNVHCSWDNTHTLSHYLLSTDQTSCWHWNKLHRSGSKVTDMTLKAKLTWKS